MEAGYELVSGPGLQAGESLKPRVTAMHPGPRAPP